MLNDTILRLFLRYTVLPFLAVPDTCQTGDNCLFSVFFCHRERVHLSDLILMYLTLNCLKQLIAILIYFYFLNCFFVGFTSCIRCHPSAHYFIVTLRHFTLHSKQNKTQKRNKTKQATKLANMHVGVYEKFPKRPPVIRQSTRASLALHPHVGGIHLPKMTTALGGMHKPLFSTATEILKAV